MAVHDEHSGAVQCRIRVRAVPGSNNASIVGPYGTAWKVRVTAAPEKGKANLELCSLLAGTLGVSKGAVSVVSGLGTRDKVVAIEGLSAAQVNTLLHAACR